MYTYLKSKGIESWRIRQRRQRPDRNKNFNIKDPDATSWKSWDTSRIAGPPRGWEVHAPTRISDYIITLVSWGRPGQVQSVLRRHLDSRSSGRHVPQDAELGQHARAGGRRLSGIHAHNKIPEPDGGAQEHASMTIPDADNCPSELKKRAEKVGYTGKSSFRPGSTASARSTCTTPMVPALS